MSDWGLWLAIGGVVACTLAFCTWAICHEARTRADACMSPTRRDCRTETAGYVCTTSGKVTICNPNYVTECECVP
jgi:hypothetical protein